MSNIFRIKVYLALICSVISRMLSRNWSLCEINLCGRGSVLCTCSCLTKDVEIGCQTAANWSKEKRWSVEQKSLLKKHLFTSVVTNPLLISSFQIICDRRNKEQHRKDHGSEGGNRCRNKHDWTCS